MQLRFACSHAGEAGADFERIEAAGFDRIILGNAAGGREAMLLAAAALDATDRLGVTLPHRPGAISPVLFARSFAALAGRGGGRLSLFVEPGHPGDGSPSQEASLARVDEHLTLLDRLWLNERPIDHEGEHYRLHRAFIGTKPQGAMPEIRMGGLTGSALQVAGRHADLFHLPASRPDEATSLIGRVREAASRRGRGGKIRFAIPMDLSHLMSGHRNARPTRTLSLASEIQRMAAVLAAYSGLGVEEFIVGGLRSEAAIEAFGAHVLPGLRALLQREEWRDPFPLAPAGTPLSA